MIHPFLPESCFPPELEAVFNGITTPAAYRKFLSGWAWHLLQNHDDAEDLCQDICILCWSKRSQFRGEAHFGTWLYRIMVNAYKSFLHRRGRRREFVEAEVGESVLQMAQKATAQKQSEEAEYQEVLKAVVQAVLSQLSERHRQLLEW